MSPHLSLDCLFQPGESFKVGLLYFHRAVDARVPQMFLADISGIF